MVFVNINIRRGDGGVYKIAIMWTINTAIMSTKKAISKDSPKGLYISHLQTSTAAEHLSNRNYPFLPLFPSFSSWNKLTDCQCVASMKINYFFLSKLT